MFEQGEKRMQEFKDILTTGRGDENIFTPITRESWKSFEDTKVKASVKVDGKIKDIASQRDVLGILAAKSDQEKSSVDIDKALTYLLAAVSLPLACGDGGMRKTNKSKLYDVLKSLGSDFTITRCDGENYYFIDLAATLRATVNLPNTFEELAIMVFSDISQFYKLIYFACDTYKDASIKGAERENRGCSDKLLIRSSKMKIPRDFQRFLNNGKNKERLFELFEETYIQRKLELHDWQIYSARDNLCKVVTATSIES